MGTRRHTKERCPPDALKLLGDYTTLRIVDFLSESGLRFTELRRALTDTNSVTLSNRLRRMTEAGLLERSASSLNRQCVTYTLSGKGRALLPILREIKIFGRQYHRSPPP
jgi:DNA-binding HxlR family transcriptional regulator